MYIHQIIFLNIYKKGNKGFLTKLAVSMKNTNPGGLDSRHKKYYFD